VASGKYLLRTNLFQSVLCLPFILKRHLELSVLPLVDDHHLNAWRYVVMESKKAERSVIMAEMIMVVRVTVQVLISTLTVTLPRPLVVCIRRPVEMGGLGLQRFVMMAWTMGRVVPIVAEE
jgi:hypothetical protein